MLRFLIHRPIAVSMIFLACLVAGLFLSRQLPVSLLPDLPIPSITVQVQAANISARELENTVTTPLRNQLMQVTSLRDIHSRTRNGSAHIQLDLAFGANMSLSFIEINEKIDQIISALPRGLERPRVVKANLSDIPVLYLNVIPRDTVNGPMSNSLELSEFGQKILKKRIEQIPEVAFVDISGQTEAAIYLKLKPEAAHSLHLTDQDLARIIQNNNLNLGNILVEDGHYQFNLQIDGALHQKEDIENLWFRHNDRLFQIRDVASVQMSHQSRRSKYLYNQREGLVFAIRKKADARLFGLKESVDQLLVDLEANYPQLEFQLSNDQSEILQVSMDNLKTSLYYGAAFAFLILLIFFREWRGPVLIGLAIPLALVLALLGFSLLGMSVNIISLAGLILGVGLMIDNSIIVIDNIRQHQQLGIPRKEACIQGGNEVIRPLISSALTTCSVFLPLIFLSGMAGLLFFDQAVSISLALFGSLLVAYLLLPTLLANMGGWPKSCTVKAQSWLQQAVVSPFAYSVNLVLGYKSLTFLLFLGTGILGYWQYQGMQQEAFPEISRKGLEVSIDWNVPISLTESEGRVRQMLQYLEADFQQANTFLGEDQFLLSSEERGLNECHVLLFTQAERYANLENKVRNYLKQGYPAAVWQLEPVKNVMDEIFQLQHAPLQIHLQSKQGIELPKLEDLDFLLSYLEAQNISFTLPSLREDFAIRIKREEALRYGLSYQHIYQRLQTIFNQNELASLRTLQQHLPVILGSDLGGIRSAIQKALVVNQDGQDLPLFNFVEVERQQQYKNLTAGKGGEALNIVLEDYRPGLEAEIRNLMRQDGRFGVQFSGQQLENVGRMQELWMVLAVALALLYFILAAQFESLLLPLLVMATVPIGLSGALLSLGLGGQSLNLISLIGMVVMSGIVINDAILKVDMIKRLEKEHDLRTALHGAGHRRLRPIMMTSLTTILALLPILFSDGLGAELQRPLALAVMGGLVAGTLGSLYFIPTLYSVIHTGFRRKDLERS